MQGRFFKYLDDKTPQGESIKIKMRIPQGQQKEFQKELDVLFEGVKNDEEFEKRMDQFEDMHTPKYKIYQKCREEFRSVLDAYIAGTLPKDRALLLLKSKYHSINEEIFEIEKRGGFIIIDNVPEEFLDISMGVTKYYIEMRHSIESIDGSNTDASQTPKEKYITLPPVFDGVLKEGLLSNAPVNGKYSKMGGKKDKNIIKHIIDYSPYADTLTADLYLQHIQTSVKPQTIGQYISWANSEAK